MNSDPPIAITWDYMIELTDDGQQPDQPEPAVIIIPPAPANSGTDAPVARANASAQE